MARLYDSSRSEHSRTTPPVMCDIGPLSSITSFLKLSNRDLLMECDRRGILPWDHQSIIDDPTILHGQSNNDIRSPLIRLIIEDKLREHRVHKCLLYHKTSDKIQDFARMKDGVRVYHSGYIKCWFRRKYNNRFLYPHKQEIARIDVDPSTAHEKLLHLYCSRIIDARLDYEQIIAPHIVRERSQLLKRQKVILGLPKTSTSSDIYTHLETKYGLKVIETGDKEANKRQLDLFCKKDTDRLPNLIKSLMDSGSGYDYFKGLVIETLPKFLMVLEEWEGYCIKHTWISDLTVEKIWDHITTPDIFI